MAGVKEKLVNLDDLKGAYDEVNTDLASKVGSGNITNCKLWSGTKEQFDDIVTKDPNTIYHITDDEGIVGKYLSSAKAEKEKFIIVTSTGETIEFSIANKVDVGNIENCRLWSGTKEQFDAIGVKEDNVLYYVTDEETPTTGAMTYKGTCLQADLPTSGLVKGDYYKLSDTAPSIYVGQCAIWNGSAWDYSTANITVDKTLDKDSDNPIANKPVAVALENLVQSFYDGLYPVNGPVVISFAAPGIPTGVKATWEEDKTYSGRYLKLDGANASGTKEAESLPKPTITIEKSDKHSHKFTPNGSLDAQGGHAHHAVNWAGYPLTAEGGNDTFGMTFVNTWKNGYTPAWSTDTQGEHKHNFTGTQGTTEKDGEHTHTATISGGVYSTGASVKPLTVTLKAWKRIA